MGDIGDEAAVLFVEDVLFFAGEEEVGEGLADFVGDVGQVEMAFFASRSDEDFLADFLDRGIMGHRKGVMPGEAGFLFGRGGDEAFESDVFFVADILKHGGGPI